MKLDLDDLPNRAAPRPTMNVAVIDYGVGNVMSVVRALRRQGADVQVTSSAEVVRAAQKIVLPGVGAFDAAMQQLRNRQLLPVLQQRVIDERTPILGICLGMQLFARGSAEGQTPGLEWIDAEVRHFDLEQCSRLKVPHIGWNRIEFEQSHALQDVFEEPCHAYFAHSFHLVGPPEHVVAQTVHGERFASIIQADNLFGVQFHPEKSHRNGARFLQYFLDR